MKINKTLKAFGFVMSAVLFTVLITSLILFSIKFFGPILGATITFAVLIAFLTFVVRNVLYD